MWRLVQAITAASLQVAYAVRSLGLIGHDVGGGALRAAAGRGCAELENRGTHFTVDVLVGTPGQRFSVVADTGSNSLIVPSCLCQKSRKCATAERCFTGTNKSSTFKMDPGPESMVLGFGSGQIQGVRARDVVRIGEGQESLQSCMDDGLLLMVDRALNIQGPFEGILGLGAPQGSIDTAMATEPEDAIDKSLSNGADANSVADAVSGGGHVEQAMNQVRGVGGLLGAPPLVVKKHLPKGGAQNATRHPAGPLIMRRNSSRAPPRGFLEQAGVDRFSVCFNEGAKGVLRLGTDAAAAPHGGAGQEHWGVDFRGFSVGKGEPSDALFCQPGPMPPGQQTPCGAIPDSGTTVLMGPKEQVGLLLETICDNWDRCLQNYTTLEKGIAVASSELSRVYGFNPFNMTGMSKADVLQVLLLDCGSWLGAGGSLDELPPLLLHVAGSAGTKQTLKLPPHLYVMESSVETMAGFTFVTGGEHIPLDTSEPGSKMGKVCSPAVGVINYITKVNGPVWILGTPLFYEFVVGYDTTTKPPSISFTSQEETPCGGCAPSVEGREGAPPPSVNFAAGQGPKRSPIKIHGPVRLPNIDVHKPF